MPLCSRAACMPPAPDVALVACIPHQARAWLDKLRQPAGRTLGDARCGGKHIHRRARQPEGALQAVLDLPAAAPQLSARPSPARNARACELAQAQRATQPCRRQWLCTCTGSRARCAFGPRRRPAARRARGAGARAARHCKSLSAVLGPSMRSSSSSRRSAGGAAPRAASRRTRCSSSARPASTALLSPYLISHRQSARAVLCSSVSSFWRGVWRAGRMPCRQAERGGATAHTRRHAAAVSSQQLNTIRAWLAKVGHPTPHLPASQALAGGRTLTQREADSVRGLPRSRGALLRSLYPPLQKPHRDRVQLARVPGDLGLDRAAGRRDLQQHVRLPGQHLFTLQHPVPTSVIHFHHATEEQDRDSVRGWHTSTSKARLATPVRRGAQTGRGGGLRQRCGTGSSGGPSHSTKVLPQQPCAERGAQS